MQLHSMLFVIVAVSAIIGLPFGQATIGTLFPGINNFLETLGLGSDSDETVTIDSDNSTLYIQCHNCRVNLTNWGESAGGSGPAVPVASPVVAANTTLPGSMVPAVTPVLVPAPAPAAMMPVPAVIAGTGAVMGTG